MPRPVDLVAVGDAWVAEPIVESPKGSNCCRIPREFGPIGGAKCYAWCAATVTLAVGRVFGRELFRSAAVSQWIAAAKQGVSGMAWVPADGWITAGMLVCYDFGPANGKPKGNPANFHMAMVRDPGTQGRFGTAGGNEGDAMRHAWRDRKYVIGFIALPYDTAAPPIQGDFDMTPGQCRDLVGRKWFFIVGVTQQLEASVDGAAFFPIGGIWTSGCDALTEDDGRIVITGRAADGQLQQCIIYTDGNTVKSPGSAPEFELLGGRIFPN